MEEADHQRAQTAGLHLREILTHTKQAKGGKKADEGLPGAGVGQGGGTDGKGTRGSSLGWLGVVMTRVHECQSAPSHILKMGVLHCMQVTPQ